MKKLGFGLMRLPYADNPEWGNIDLEKTKEMVDAYMAQGFTYFDTAWVYHGGKSELAFGKLVAERYPHEKYQVATKMPFWDINTEEDLERIFNEQLSKCKVDYFDYYLLHALNRGLLEKIEKLHGFEFVQKKKAEGKIKHIGFSFHDSADALELILSRHPEVEFVQLQINYIDWESNDVQSRKCFEIAAEKYNKMITVMEPLKGGNLAQVNPKAEKLLKEARPDLSVASWGIRYVASMKNIITVLSGMSNMEQLEDNMSYMKDFEPLSESEQKVVSEVSDIVKKSILLPCTGCRYCVDGCPKKIVIPEFFKLYNEQNQYSLTGGLKWRYGEAIKKGGAPADCISCGQCERHCPQNIKIIDELKNVVKVFGAS